MTASAFPTLKLKIIMTKQKRKQKKESVKRKLKREEEKQAHEHNRVSKQKNNYVPNILSANYRLFYSLLIIFIMGYGLVGYLNDSLYLPARYSRGVTLVGDSIIIMIASFLFLSLALVSYVIDHYDKRNNEKYYVWFQRFAYGTAFILLIIALIVPTIQLK